MRLKKFYSSGIQQWKDSDTTSHPDFIVVFLSNTVYNILDRQLDLFVSWLAS